MEAAFFKELQGEEGEMVKRFGYLFKQCLPAILFITQASAYAQSQQSMNAAVVAALAGNPRVLAAESQRRAAEAELKSARGGYLPSVDLAVASGRKNTTSPATKPGGVFLNERRVGIVTAQTLYDGGAVSSEIESRKAKLDAAIAHEREVREQVGYDAVIAYIDTLKAGRLLGLAEDNAEIHRQFVDKMATLASVDPGRGSELSQARTRSALAESIKATRRARLGEAHAQYANVFGAPPGSLAEVDEPSGLPSSIGAAVDRALSANPGLAVSAANLVAASAAVQSARSAKQPRIQFQFASNRDQNISGMAGRFNDSSVMVVANWNLFRGGSDTAKEAAAIAEWDASRDGNLDARRLVEERVTTAWHTRQGHLESNSLLLDQVKYGIEVLSAYRDQFRINRRTLLDVLNAEAELFTARTSLVTSRYDAISAAYRLIALSGNLSGAFQTGEKENVRGD